MNRRASFLMVSCVLLAAAGRANADDEQQIRELVKKADAGVKIKHTDDSIFVAGGLQRPLVGKERDDFSAQHADEMKKDRPNQKKQTTIRRLVIAQSGDLAYDFSDVKVSWDGKDGKPAGLEASHLRVWRKKNGEWLEEAIFARPNNLGDRADKDDDKAKPAQPAK